jgi:hypothetical protein
MKYILSIFFLFVFKAPSFCQKIYSFNYTYRFTITFKFNAGDSILKKGELPNPGLKTRFIVSSKKELSSVEIENIKSCILHNKSGRLSACENWDVYFIEAEI